MVCPVPFFKKTAVDDNRGFTLVEMMMATFILAVSILGLASATLTSIKTNKQNELRNAAIRLTNETVESYLVESIDTVANDKEKKQVNLRGVNLEFEVVSTVNSLTFDLKQIQVDVNYEYQGVPFTNTAVAYKHRSI